MSRVVSVCSVDWPLASVKDQEPSGFRLATRNRLAVPLKDVVAVLRERRKGQ